jgi:hypothetical protein
VPASKKDRTPKRYPEMRSRKEKKSQTKGLRQMTALKRIGLPKYGFFN